MALAAVGVILGATSSKGATRHATAFNRAAAKAVVAYARRDATITSVFQACPSDVAGTMARATPHRGAMPKVDEQACGPGPWHCFRACRFWGDGRACFSLARLYQLRPKLFEPLEAERWFAMACAVGFGGGCTNRAAGIRNAHYPGDPFERADRTTKEACTFRGFKTGCERDNAWGCAMLGDAYRFGEGTPVDAQEAKRAYDKSCELAPAFEACTFAQHGLDDLKRPPASD